MTDQEIILGLKYCDSKTIKEFDKKYKKLIYNVSKKCGILNKNIRDEIYSSTLITLWTKFQNEFTLTSKFSTYIYKVTKYISLKYKLDPKNNIIELTPEHDIIEEYEYFEDSEKMRIFNHILYNKLNDDERQLLELTLEGKSQEEIAIIMSYKDRTIVKSKKYKVIHDIKNMVKKYNVKF